MKSTVVSVTIALALIGGEVVLARGGADPDAAVPANNVSIVNGIQIVDVRARGGYQPRRSIARAGIPTVLRFSTSGTFDCSVSLRIPSMGFSTILPQTGTTDVDLGLAKAGILKGMCGMGMYPFEVDFQG